MAYEDLLKDSSSPLDNKNYFNLTITDLNISTPYPLQFRWKYEDGTFGPWSAVKTISVPAESFPNVPSTLTVADNTPGYLEITWNGNTSTGVPLTNFDRVDIYINGAPFDSSKPAMSFFSAGTKTIVAPAGVYIISSYAVSKIGTLSAMSTAVTRTVTAIGIPVQTPTLPSGITVATAPFAVTVNWAGTYSTSTFTGFKSIDIYAVSSDLGSSATSGISSTNLVGSLTVNDTPNKINISLDNLRQALNLASNSDVYSANIFYYFNATNTNGNKYGSPTYTRINSSSVIPTKANFVDLASGVISIENLVAGNGQFAAWLRTGTAGGSRIELSSVSDFTNSGYTVQKGLVAYSSGNNELFNLDLDAGSLTINGSGTFSGSLSAASGTFTGSLNIGTPSSGLYPFSVSSSGILRAIAGTIGGWTLGDGFFQGSNFQINGNQSIIYVGPTGGAHLRISAAGIASYTGGSANGILNIAANGNIQATSGTFSGALSGATGTFSGTLSAGDITGSSYTNVSGGTGITISRSGTLDQILFQSGGSTSGVIASGTATGSTGIQITAAGGTSSGFATSSNGSAALFSSSSGGIQGLTIVSGGAAQFSSSVTVFNSNNILLSGSGGSFSANTLTLINSNGTIYANTLGTGSGLAIHQVQSGGNAGYLKVNTSTIRHKENINYIDQAGYLNKVANMSPVLFNYKEGYGDPSRLEIGLIAEDLEELGGFETVLHYNNDNELMGISYDKLSAMLILSIKELKSRLDALEG